MEDRILQIVLKAKDEASEIISAVGKKTEGVADLLKNSFNKAAIASGVALGALTVEAIRSVHAFEESQKVTAQLQSVLKSTGGVAGVTADQAQYLAGRLQNVTTYSDETILSAENLLLTFTKIGKDIFPDATKTVLDMSTALGQDTKASAIQLGKALQDPIRGVTALRRVGVSFTEDQIKMIKSLVQSGKQLEAQKFILKELQTEFGGSAVAAGSTFGGQLTILKNVINDLEEAFGGMIANALKPFVNNLKEVIDATKEVLAGNAQVSYITETLAERFGLVGRVLGTVIAFFVEHKQAAIALAGAIGGFLSISIIAATIAMATFIGISLPAILIFAAIGAAIALLIANWDAISGFFTGITTIVTTTFTNIGTFIQTILTTISQTINFALQFIYQIFNTLFTLNIPFIVGFAIGWLTVAIPQLVANIITWLNALPGAVLAIFTQVVLFITTKVTEAVVWLGEELSSWPARVSAWITSIPSIVSNVFENVKQAAIAKMQELFAGVQDIWNKVKGIFDAIRGAAEAAINAVRKGFEAGKSFGVKGFAHGGYVPQTGLAIVHAGEFVLSKGMLAGNQSIPSSVSSVFNQPITINAVIDNEMDLNILGYKLAWAMRNSR